MAPPSTEPRFFYQIFGMRVDSDLPIAGLAAADPLGVTDLSFRFRETPALDGLAESRVLRYASVDSDPTGEPVMHVWELGGGALLHIAYCDGTCFWINQELTVVWAAWPSSSSLESALTYLVGPVLGLLLRLKGVVCLHASAVIVEDYAVAFCGSEGAGKSTTAAALAQQGLAVLADDVVALKAVDPSCEHTKDHFDVMPAYPRVNLWPTAVQLVFGREDALPLIVEDWDKRYLELGKEQAARFGDRSRRLGVVYILQDGDPADNVVSSLPRKDALLSLVANTYATNLLTQEQRADEFAFLSRLVEAVPVRKLNPRHGVWSLKQLCDVIRQDAHNLGIQQPCRADSVC